MPPEGRNDRGRHRMAEARRDSGSAASRPRPTLEFENGTSFHFVDGSPGEVLKQAQAAAGDKDVKVNGGTFTVRSFWKARLLDEPHLVMSPVFVGEGERLLGGVDGYEVAGFEASEAAVHYRIEKKG